MNVRSTWLTTLILTLGASLALAQVNLDNFKYSDGKICPLVGSARSLDGKALNRLKNRYVGPKQSEINPAITLAAMLKPGDDLTRFKPAPGATLTGYCIDVKRGGNETCNCKHAADVDRDTHIELSLGAGAPEIERVVVEVTPRTRSLKKKQGLDWSTDALKGPNGIEGKWVKVTGWVMFDSMHVHEAENTNPGGSGNWRATGWELHPVTDIQKVAAPQPVGAAATAVATAQKTRRAALNEAQRLALRGRNEKILARYPKEDRDEF